MTKKGRKGNQSGNQQDASAKTTEDTLPEPELSKQDSQDAEPNPATKPDLSQQNAPQKKVEETSKDISQEVSPSNPSSKSQSGADHKSSQEQTATSEPAIVNFHKLDLKTDPLSIPPEETFQQVEPHVEQIVPQLSDQSSTINVLESSLNSIHSNVSGSLMTQENANSSRTEDSKLVFSDSKEVSEKIEGSMDKQEEPKIEMMQPIEKYSESTKTRGITVGHLFPMTESEEINVEDSQVISMGKSASAEKHQLNHSIVHEEEAATHPPKEQLVVHVPKEEMVAALKVPEETLKVKQMENMPKAQFRLSVEKEESAISASVAETVIHVGSVPETILPVVKIAELAPHQVISEMPAKKAPVIQIAVPEVSIPQLAVLGEERPQLAVSGEEHPQLAVSGEERPQLAVSGEERPQLAVSGEERPQLQQATQISQQARDNLESDNRSRTSSVHATQVREIVESKGYGNTIPQFKWTADTIQLQKSAEEVKQIIPHTIETDSLHKSAHKAYHRSLSGDLAMSEERELERSNCSDAIVEEQRQLLLRKEEIGKPLLNLLLILGPLGGIMTYVASKNKLLSMGVGGAIGLATVVYTLVTPTQNLGGRMA